MTRELDAAFGDEPREAVARLNRAGRQVEAARVADELLATLVDPTEILGVQLSKLSVLFNLGRNRECSLLIADVWRLIEQHPDLPVAYIAEYHALVAFRAYCDEDFEACVTSLARGAKSLDAAAGGDSSMRPWVTMAVTYSYLGFHSHAVAAQQRALDLAVNDDQRKLAGHPEIVLRHAVFLDQTGATEASKAMLVGLVEGMTTDDVIVQQQPWLGYATARYAALGERCDTDSARPLLHTAQEPIPLIRELGRLGEAALSIGERRPDAALNRLRGASSRHTRLGRAEVPRLRALAHAVAGDHAAAHQSEREAMFLVAKAADPLYDLFVSQITAHLDVNELLRKAESHAAQALVDPLTGLPNRRSFEEYVADLTHSAEPAVIGVADLDHFKDVNTTHGHLVGDRVLATVAKILSDSLRSGDFLARYGGDEFVMVLRHTTMPEAQDVSARLLAALAAHPWPTLAPGTPVTMTVGLAELDAAAEVTDAFEAADLLMLRAKEARAAAGEGVGPPTSSSR